MDPLTVTAAGAALGFLGQAHANATNVRLGREQMAFQERMSNTAHQRNRRDLEAAGYNPMLGVGGSGASTPVGASPRVDNAPGAGITSGISAARAQAEINLLKEQAVKVSSEELLARTQARHLERISPRQVESVEADTRLRGLDADTRERLLPLVAERMSSETARDLNSALASREHAGLLRAERILKEFEQQHAKNLNEASKSWYFRKVAPYVSSVGEVMRIGSSMATPIMIGRGTRAFTETRSVRYNKENVPTGHTSTSTVRSPKR